MSIKRPMAAIDTNHLQYSKMQGEPLADFVLGGGFHRCAQNYIQLTEIKVPAVASTEIYNSIIGEYKVKKTTRAEKVQSKDEPEHQRVKGELSIKDDLKVSLDDADPVVTSHLAQHICNAPCLICPYEAVNACLTRNDESNYTFSTMPPSTYVYSYEFDVGANPPLHLDALGCPSLSPQGLVANQATAL